jgi:hypothetical protein
MASQKGEGVIFTSHVFLAFENNESITSMGLLLLVRLLVGMGVGNDANL